MGTLVTCLLRRAEPGVGMPVPDGTGPSRWPVPLCPVSSRLLRVECKLRSKYSWLGGLPRETRLGRMLVVPTGTYVAGY